jgi:hypothetical protein
VRLDARATSRTSWHAGSVGTAIKAHADELGRQHDLVGSAGSAAVAWVADPVTATLKEYFEFDSFDFVERNLIFCAIIELRGARRLMRGNLLRVL